MINLQSSVLNDSYVEYKIQQVKKAVCKIAPSVLSKGLLSYAEVASRNMPPPKSGTKSRSIPSKYYKREVWSIDQMYKKSKNEKVKRFLIHQKIKGYKFGVTVYENRGKNKKIYFSKSERELKSKYGRIKYRGLYKWLWGANLSQIGQATPNMFSRLLSKSPDLASKANLTSYTKMQNKNEVQIKADYKADGISYFAKQAQRQAKKAMKSKMKKLFQSGVSQEIAKIR